MKDLSGVTPFMRAERLETLAIEAGRQPESAFYDPAEEPLYEEGSQAILEGFRVYAYGDDGRPLIVRRNGRVQAV